MKNILKKNQLMITALAIMIAIAGYLQFAESTTGMDQEGALAVDSGQVITEKYVAGDDALNAPVTEGLEGILDLSDEDLLGEIYSLDSDLVVSMEDYLEEGMDGVVKSKDGLDGQDLMAMGDGIEEPVNATPQEGEIPGEAVFTSAGAAILSDAKLLKEQTRAKNKAMLLDIIGNEYLSEEQKQQAVGTMVEMTQIAEKEAAAEILLEAKGFSDVVVSISAGGVDVVVNAASLTDAQRAQIEDIVCRKTDVSPENLIISTVVRD